jgi:hypothetical protein
MYCIAESSSCKNRHTRKGRGNTWLKRAWTTSDHTKDQGNHGLASTTVPQATALVGSKHEHEEDGPICVCLSRWSAA